MCEKRVFEWVVVGSERKREGELIERDFVLSLFVGQKGVDQKREESEFRRPSLFSYTHFLFSHALIHSVSMSRVHEEEDDDEEDDDEAKVPSFSPISLSLIFHSLFLSNSSLYCFLQEREREVHVFLLLLCLFLRKTHLFVIILLRLHLDPYSFLFSCSWCFYGAVVPLNPFLGPDFCAVSLLLSPVFLCFSSL